MCLKMINTISAFSARSGMPWNHFNAMSVERWNENMQPFKPLQNKMEALQQHAFKGLSAEQNQNNRGQNKNCNGDISGSNKQNNWKEERKNCKPCCCPTKLLIFLAPGRGLALTQLGGSSFLFIFYFLDFLLFQILNIRAVYKSLVCSLHFGSLTRLFWIIIASNWERCLYFCIASWNRNACRLVSKAHNHS